MAATVPDPEIDLCLSVLSSLSHTPPLFHLLLHPFFILPLYPPLFIPHPLYFTFYYISSLSCLSVLSSLSHTPPLFRLLLHPFFILPQSLFHSLLHPFFILSLIPSSLYPTIYLPSSHLFRCASSFTLYPFQSLGTKG